MNSADGKECGRTIHVRNTGFLVSESQEGSEVSIAREGNHCPDESLWVYRAPPVHSRDARVSSGKKINGT